MNLPELITKLLIIEIDLIQQGIEVNSINVVIPKYDNDTTSNYVAPLNDIAFCDNNIELNSY